ncbi:Selenocysteine-specific translation elongation factor [Acidisarcina polymorpha]|uniref:Selenocysteine-specific elongation factor n=1 Tax=Acidisarcina polymorpha TaxID=2211140 RepID=A0A2Z5G675_9BACT|nr:selenocysteine-specific translation elongation factor [Acidisarcina polymorpha]AXC14056.1 Selenocysteine-specific translation elongation factor [Acidisarcina polymorpha]
MTPPLKSIVIGTAGHIDHGKTALIHALTGVDADRLPEEKRRGITIDLGFASLDETAPDGTPLRISFVDVPGHALFIRNMLAGAGGVDAVLLVIAANEGVKPQTREHLAICGLLGVRRGITTISKVDAVSPERLDQVLTAVRAFLRGTFLDASESRILPVSAKNGEGLAELRHELRALAVDTKVRQPDHVSRLPIDRAFMMKGFGTVVTGTLLSGTVFAGESLALEPGGRTVRVRGLQTHGHSEARVSAGSRVALNLTGIEVSKISRGQTFVEPEMLTATSTIDAEVMLLPGVAALKHRERLHFHAFTTETLASVSLYGYNSVEPGAKRIVRLKLNDPVLLLPGDRFVLRQLSPAATIGGGRVLDAQPIEKLKKAECLAWLESMGNASLEEQVKLRIGRRKTRGVSLRELVRETGLTPEAMIRHLNILVSRNNLGRFAGDLFLTKDAVEAAAEAVLLRLEMKSNQKGIKLSELKSQIGLSGEVFEYLVEGLFAEQKLCRQGEMVFSRGAAPQPSGEDDPIQSKIEGIYKNAGLASPSTNEVATVLGITDDQMRRSMTMLLRDKTMVRMGTDPVYIHRQALDELRAQFKGFRGQTIDVARFKQITGLSRKYAIPLLEYLDRERVTRKEGDRRLVL